jgi:thioredoxin 1
MSEPINIKGKEEFKKVVLNSKTPILVDFWAGWCMPCRMMAPVLEEIADKYEDKLIIAKINTEEPENMQLAFEYQIQSIPNMKLFKSGKVVQEYLGYRPKEIFENELKAII